MSRCQYLHDLGCETKEREYKVFTTNWHKISHKEALELLRIGRWVFDSQVNDIIKLHIETYFPKYLASFSHPKSDLKKGLFYIGVEDDGIIHGIPYSGVLTVEYVNELIMTTLNRIRSVSSECIEMYMSLVKVEVIELDKTNYLKDAYDIGLDSDYSTKMYLEISENIRQEEEKYNKYIKKKRNWEFFMESIPQQINNILNEPKICSQLLDIVRDYTKSTTKLEPKYKNIYGYCEIKNDYWSLIQKLKSKNNYKKLEFEDAENNRENMLSPFCWAMKWRDIKTKPSKILKPIPYLLKKNNTALTTVCDVPKMLPSWIKNGSEINLYIIKITFPRNISPEFILEYQNKNKKWVQSYRTVINGEPSCNPIV
jgi:hypothetical protein